MLIYLLDVVLVELVLLDQQHNVAKNALRAAHLGLLVAQFVADEEVEGARNHLGTHLRYPPL